MSTKMQTVAPTQYGNIPAKHFPAAAIQDKGIAENGESPFGLPIHSFLLTIGRRSA